MEGVKVLVLLFTSVIVGTFADEDHGTYAKAYSKDNFSTEIVKKPHFVMFFAPWCGHCKKLAPTWDKLAQKYNSELEEKEVIIAKVDCTAETSVCSDHEVTGYPTLKFFKDGESKERYRGGRDMDTLDKYIKTQLGTTEEEPEEEEEVKAPEPKKGLFELTAASFPSHVEKGHHFIKFYAPWCGHCQRLAPTWEKLAETFEKDDSVSISKLDCTAHREICSTHGVGGYPTLLWFSKGVKVEKYQGSRDHDALQKYVDKMKGKTDEREKATEEKIPEKEEAKEKESDVIILSADNFDEEIKTGATFVKFFAPWCGHCKRLAPTWEELGTKYAESKNVKIAKVDCTTDRELCSKHGVNGYPTLILFRQGAKHGDYNGARSLDALANFITEKLPRDEL